MANYAQLTSWHQVHERDGHSWYQRCELDEILQVYVKQWTGTSMHVHNDTSCQPILTGNPAKYIHSE